MYKIKPSYKSTAQNCKITHQYYLYKDGIVQIGLKSQITDTRDTLATIKIFDHKPMFAY